MSGGSPRQGCHAEVAGGDICPKLLRPTRKTEWTFSARIGVLVNSIVFSHERPLSSDDRDNQMLFFLGQGEHGRSTRVGDRHDMDHYADDLFALTAHLDLKDAIHVGHSTNGGEVVRYLARPWSTRCDRSCNHQRSPALDVEDRPIPDGSPRSVSDDLQAQLAANRSKFCRDLPKGRFSD